MSKRDALKALSRVFPVPEETGVVLDGLKGKGDRETVIVTGALVESCLERALLYELPKMSPELAGALFQNRGPLSDFHGKILMALAMGVIHETVGVELKIIKNVRNAFAHTISDISFATKEVRDELAKSHMIELLNVELLKIDKNHSSTDLGIFGQLFATSLDRDNYISMVSICCSLLGFETGKPR